LGDTHPEHYPSRIMEPVLTRSRFTTSRAKTLQRLAFEARLDGSWGGVM
jgi:hypothetical protein